MTKDVRALELYELAQSVVDAKGHFMSVGVLTYKEIRQEDLSIRKPTLHAEPTNS